MGSGDSWRRSSSLSRSLVAIVVADLTVRRPAACVWSFSRTCFVKRRSSRSSGTSTHRDDADAIRVAASLARRVVGAIEPKP